MQQYYDMDIVLPCYNPQADFIAVLDRRFSDLKAAYPDKKLRLIVSNDGSTCNFDPQVQKKLQQTIPGTLIVDNKKNGGKGVAVRAGIAASTAPYTLYTDIDMPYSLESMCQVIDKTFADTDIVIAVRNSSYYSKLKPLRKLMSHGSQLMNRLFLGIKFTDTQGGLKGLSPKARKIMLQTRIKDFLFDTEFIVLAARQKDIHIVNIETNLREEVVMSKMSLAVLVRESLNFFKIATRR
ncbi:glycosyltransferase family 2 protein [Sphingobacterium sp. Mn56C]|uniref:glycosyltransferase family 2 protein n=1 Tax=Sphingobacterium sp. Mn56C TaxID=3395261 RepID=UPI003BE06FA3